MNRLCAHFSIYRRHLQSLFINLGVMLLEMYENENIEIPLSGALVLVQLDLKRLLGILKESLFALLQNGNLHSPVCEKREPVVHWSWQQA